MYNAEINTNEKMQKDYEWIMKVIISCETVFQLKCCYKLIDSFKFKYDESREEIEYMMDKLIDKQSVIEAFY